MDKIIKKFEIRKHDHLFNLEDIVKKIVESKSPATYINKIQDKQRINSHYFVTKIKFLELLSKSKSKKCKEALKMIQDGQEIDKPVGTSNQVALMDNKLTFEGTGFYYFKGDNDSIWFKGKDIASILGYQNSRKAVSDHVDDDDKLSFKELIPAISSGMKGKNDNMGNKTLPMKGKNDNMGSKILPMKSKNDIVSSKFNFKDSTIFINESGLYSLIISSKLDKAKIFKRWVTSEVLPSIRKKGKYEIQKTDVKELPDLNKFIGKSCLYLIHIKDNIYKYGITRKIKERMSSHKKDLDYKREIEVWEVKERETVENKISNLLNQWNIKIIYQTKTECFQTSDDITIDHVIAKINEYINEYKNEKKEENISDEITKLNIQLKLKELDIKEKEINLIYELMKHCKVTYLESISSKYFGVNNSELIEDSKPVQEIESDNDTIYDESSDDEIEDDKVIEELSESEDEQPKEDNSECIDCGTSISKQATRCQKCLSKIRFDDAVKGRPSLKKLKEQVTKHGYTGTGRIYNVSDNTIRKWIKKYEIHNNS